MNMTNYFPTYVKRNSTVPEWAADPACFLYLPLYALDGPKIKSLDRYGYSITNNGGAAGTSKGMYFDGVNDYLSWYLPASTTFTELTAISWFNPHGAWPSGSGAYRPIYINSRRSGSPYIRSGFELGRSYDDGKFAFRLFDGTSDATNFNCTFSTSLISLNTFHFVFGRYKAGSLLEVYSDNVRRQYMSAVNIPPQVIVEKIAINSVASVSTNFSNFTIGMIAAFSRCLSLAELSQIFADTRGRYL